MGCSQSTAKDQSPAVVSAAGGGGAGTEQAQLAQAGNKAGGAASSSSATTPVPDSGSGTVHKETAAPKADSQPQQQAPASPAASATPIADARQLQQPPAPSAGAAQDAAAAPAATSAGAAAQDAGSKDGGGGNSAASAPATSRVSPVQSSSTSTSAQAAAAGAAAPGGAAGSGAAAFPSTTSYQPGPPQLTEQQKAAASLARAPSSPVAPGMMGGGGGGGQAGGSSSGGVGPAGGAGGGQHREKGPKARRAAAGSEAVRDQIRKMVVGGPVAAEDKGARVDAVSDSDDEEDLISQQLEAVQERPPEPKSPQVTAAICEALQRSFIFRGISEQLLEEIVQRMFCVTVAAGSTILLQNAQPSPSDCMYYLAEGQAEVVIMGTVDTASKKGNEEVVRVEGNAVRIPQGPGWVFGDVALLFNSPRTASVVAASDVVLWALDRPTFLRFVMKHAPGAHTLRFVRKVPLLKGLSDNDLLRVAGRMPERVYEDGAALIRYGERGDEMYLIRYGKVRVLVPDSKGGRIEVAVLGRGQFVGERSVINDKLRSADCVAQGHVQVVVLRKRDFLDLDNPLLAWMLDYDAVSAVLKSLPAFRGLKQDQMEHIFDRFEARQELYKGDTILAQGALVEKIYVVKMGEVVLTGPDGRPVTDPSFVKEAGGFTFFGDSCLEAITRSPYTVRVSSDLAHVLSLPRVQLDNFLGAVGVGLSSKAAVLQALQQCKSLMNLREQDLTAIADSGDPIRYSPGELVALAQPGAAATAFYLVTAGEVMLLPASLQIPPGTPQLDVAKAEQLAVGRLGPGALYNESVLYSPAAALPAHLVARTPRTTVVTFELTSIRQALGAPGGLLHRGPSQHNAQQQQHLQQQQQLLQQQQQQLLALQQQQMATAQLQQQMAAQQMLSEHNHQRAAQQQQQQPRRSQDGIVTAIPLPGSTPAAGGDLSIRFEDLELRRVIGTGQFGLVRVVRHVPTNAVYALKVMHKAPLVEAKQIEHVANERAILGEVAHPFLVGLVGAYQDTSSLYLLQEWVPGGELFHHLDIEGSFSDAAACFYAANVLLALECLHARGIVYRDLKPENLLLDTKGYIKMADFGFAKKIGSDRTFTICGTPDYQAPEVIMRRGTTRAADYWALGVLIFEMLVGDPPFKSLTGDPWDTFRRTLSGRFYVPHFISDAAADLIFKLLQVNPEKRLGCGPGGIQEIKSHRWFSRINWDALMARQLPAPILPRLTSLLDTSNFDTFDDTDVSGHQQMAAAAAAAAGGGQPDGKRPVQWDSWAWVSGLGTAVHHHTASTAGQQAAPAGSVAAAVAAVPAAAAAAMAPH